MNNGWNSCNRLHSLKLHFRCILYDFAPFFFPGVHIIGIVIWMDGFCNRDVIVMWRIEHATSTCIHMCQRVRTYVFCYILSQFSPAFFLHSIFHPIYRYLKISRTSMVCGLARNLAPIQCIYAVNLYIIIIFRLNFFFLSGVKMMFFFLDRIQEHIEFACELLLLCIELPVCIERKIQFSTF